ncbi:MAG TPA: group 1 truncated hemoglobin [Gemmatimonadaceae bacterium]|nr:group 1 truncated hemoglobin [Gemmatimonadaceae bacterium]
MSNRLRRSWITVLGFGFAFLGIIGCARKEQVGTDTLAATNTAAKIGGDTTPNKSLYDRLGGKTAIAAVVDTFVAKVAADARINKKFAKSNIPRVKTEIVDQICAETGGPCAYTGRSMKQAHLNMGVTDGEFNALIDDLTAALNAFKVPSREQNDLLSALGAMKGDIVEVHTNATGTKLPAPFKPAPALTASSTKQ